MPILTFPLALALTTCFVVGSVVTWALGERRRRSEREELERQMTRALQARYEVYEGLEQTVIKLVTKFDAMENEFKQRLVQAANPRAALDRTVRLRSSNPELWDIEREHHRVTSEQLAEISRRSVRIAQLMEQVQTLEPMTTKLQEELSQLKHRYENAVANAAEFEQASAARIERLNARIGELEPLGSLLEASQRDLAAALDVQRSASDELKRVQSELAERAQEVVQAQEQVMQLEGVVAMRDSESGEDKLRILELEGEFKGLQQQIEKTQGRCSELEQRAKTAEQSLTETSAQLQGARSGQDSLKKELEAARKELAQQTQRCEVYTADLAKARAAIDDTRAQSVTARKSADAAEARVQELEAQLAKISAEAQSTSSRQAEELSALRGKLELTQGEVDAVERSLAQEREAHAQELSKVRGDAQERLARAEELSSQLRSELQTAGARAASLEEVLEAERVRASEHATAMTLRMDVLNRELDQARAELTLHRAKLAARSNHVVEAWSVLSELKPMLETLEQKLKETDEPASALPNPPAPAPKSQPATSKEG